jgi:hypothetical protein
MHKNAGVDTAAYVVAGVGRSASTAVGAAVRDSRVKAIVLASAAPDPVDRGFLLGRVEKLQLPIFIQVAPEDLVELFYYADALYQAGDRKRSRVSESRARGRFAEQFRHDPGSNARLRQWLASTWPAP